MACMVIAGHLYQIFMSFQFFCFVVISEYYQINFYIKIGEPYNLIPRINQEYT